MERVLMFSLPTGLTNVICLRLYELLDKNKKHLWCQYFTFWCENQSFADNYVSCEFFGLRSLLGKKKTSTWQLQPLGNNTAT